MVKLSQSTYMQGALAFFKEASLDPLATEVAILELVKQASRLFEDVKLVDEYGGFDNKPKSVSNKRATKAVLLQRLEDQIAARAKLEAQLGSQVEAYGKLKSELADQISFYNSSNARTNEALSRKDSRISRLEKERSTLSRARNDLLKEQEALRGKSKAEVESLNKRLREAQSSFEAQREAQIAAAEREALAAANKNTAQTTHLHDELIRAEEKLQREAESARRARSSDAASRSRVQALEREGSGLRKSLRKANLRSAGSLGLAALGLGYIGYDQLSDSGVPRVNDLAQEDL